MFVYEWDVILKFCFECKFCVNDNCIKVNFDCFIYSYCKCFIKSVWDDSFCVKFWIFCFNKELYCDIVVDEYVGDGWSNYWCVIEK